MSPVRGSGIVGKIRIYFRWFEAGVALSGAAAFASVGPLRTASAGLPEVTLVATLILFLAPGALLARWSLNEHFSGAALLPSAFVISAGTFALLGVPVLILQGTLEAYLWVSGAVVAASLLAAALAALLVPPRRRRTIKPEADPSASDGGGMLWAPFLALVASLAYVCRINAPSVIGDIWIYLSWIREFLDGNRLAFEEPYFGGEVGLSRVRINGWLLEQAAFSRVSGVEPVELVYSYLNPALAVVALLAFYALARTLLKGEKAALFCGCLYALFFLIDLDASRLSFGGEFVSRLAEDKLAAKFVFLPMALAFAAAFLESGKRAYSWCFALVCCAVMAVHPIGLAIIGASMAGFSILHPSLLLDPVIAAAVLLGLPFLLRRLRRSLAAQLLFGAMYLTALLVYVPPVATFLGENVVLPGQIWRLAWPIPLAAVLTLGWLAWEATSRAGAWLGKLRPARPLARALPLLVAIALTVAAVPLAMSGVELIRDYEETARSGGLYPADPIYPWFRNEVTSPAVVLATDLQSVRIPAYSSETNVVSRRGSLVLRVLPQLEERASGRIEVPQGSLDVQEFFRGTSLQRGVEILRRHEVDYVMVESGSQLAQAMERLPGFEPVEEPSERYDVYDVDLQALGR